MIEITHVVVPQFLERILSGYIGSTLQQRHSRGDTNLDMLNGVQIDVAVATLYSRSLNLRS